MIASGAVFVPLYTLSGVSPPDAPDNTTLPGPWSASLLTPAVITLIGFGIRLGLDGAKLRTEAPCECGRHGPHSTLVGTGGAALADDVAIRLSAVVSGAAVVAAVVGTLDVTPAPLLPRIVTGCTPV